MDSSNFQPPIRRSLSNDDLEARVNQAMSSHSGVEAVMELLVAQEALRAQEDKEEAIWVSNLEADGSPEALAALERFRSTKPGYVAPAQPIVQESAPVIQPVYVEPIQEFFQPDQGVQSEPEVSKEPESPIFSWLNPAPTTPVVEEPVAEPVIEEPVEVAEPVLEEPAQTSFSWFTKPEPEVVDPVEVVEESFVVELEPVGSESENEFEKLLAAAAAEEELTALEESEVKTLEELLPVESNVLVPHNENRNRGPLSQIWIWLGLSATLAPVLLVWALIGLGLNATAIAIVLPAGYLVSGTLIAVGSIAGKRSGLSTATISRAAFGVWGNSLPLTVLFAARIAVTAIILGTFTYLMNGLAAKLPDLHKSIVEFAGVKVTVGLGVQAFVLILISLLVLVRGNASRIIQVLFSLLAFGLFAEGFAVLPQVGFNFTAVGTKDLFSLDALAGAALVVMLNLTIWFALAPNLSKAIPMRVRGVKVFSAVLVSNFLVPSLVGIASVLLLGPLSVTAGLTTIQAAVLALPSWAQGAMVSGTAIAIVLASMLSLRTATLDLVSLFRFKGRIAATLISSLSTVALLVLFAQQPSGQEVEYLVNLFVFIAAISAGWIGIFVADVSIRRQAYHELSLSRSYGLYKKFNILSLLIWIVSLAVAVALVPVNLMGFGFMGFALPSLGLEANLGSSAIGFVGTLLVSMLLTFAIRVPQIKKQEREVLALESRREQLNDIFVGTE